MLIYCVCFLCTQNETILYNWSVCKHARLSKMRAVGQETAEFVLFAPIIIIESCQSIYRKQGSIVKSTSSTQTLIYPRYFLCNFVPSNPIYKAYLWILKIYTIGMP